MVDMPSDSEAVSGEKIEFNAGGGCLPGYLNVPTDSTPSGVVCLPGAGHGPYGDVFDRVAETAVEHGHYFLRYESWQSPEEIGQKSLQQFHAEIDAAIELLKSRDCTDISIVGKSFGGRIALTYAPGAADRFVLWAPAIRFGDESNIEAGYTTPLADSGGLQLEPDGLTSIDVPVRLLQGDENEVVPIENSRQIVDSLPDGELIEIEGEDHSFTGKTVENITVDETLDALPT